MTLTKQITGQARLLARAVTHAKRLLADAEALGIVPAPRRRKSKKRTAPKAAPKTGKKEQKKHPLSRVKEAEE